MGIFPRNAKIFQHLQINQCDTVYQLKNINRMIISIDAKKDFENIQHPFMIKTLQRTDIEETYLNIILVVSDKSTAKNSQW